MNEKYTVLSNGSVEIIDEKGKTSNRTFKSKHFLRDILVWENKIEILDKSLEELYKKQNENNGVLYVCKNMIKAQPIIVLLLTLCGFIFGGIFSSGAFLTAAMSAGIPTLVIGTIFATVSVTFFQITKTISKKKAKGFENEINKALELKKSYEKDLDFATSAKALESSIKYEKNKITSLENDNVRITNNINEELNKAYQDGYKSKTKKLTKTKSH